VAVLSTKNITPRDRIRYCRGTIGERFERSNVLPRFETSREFACGRVRIRVQWCTYNWCTVGCLRGHPFCQSEWM